MSALESKHSTLDMRVQQQVVLVFNCSRMENSGQGSSMIGSKLLWTVSLFLPLHCVKLCSPCCAMQDKEYLSNLLSIGSKSVNGGSDNGFGWDVAFLGLTSLVECAKMKGLQVTMVALIPRMIVVQTARLATLPCFGLSIVDTNAIVVPNTIPPIPLSGHGHVINFVVLYPCIMRSSYQHHPRAWWNQ